MKIPASLDLHGLVAELRPVLIEKIGEDNPDYPKPFVDTIASFLIFFIGQLTKSFSEYRDEQGWTRIHSIALSKLNPFYVSVITLLEAKGIIWRMKGSQRLPATKLSRRTGYRLVPPYDAAEMVTVDYTPAIVKDLLPAQFVTIESGTLSYMAHPLKGFDDETVDQFIFQILDPAPIVIDDSAYQEMLNDFTPEDWKEMFLEDAQDVVDCEAPFQWKKDYLRNEAEAQGIAITEADIESLLAENEAERKRNWEATLARFGKKAS